MLLCLFAMLCPAAPFSHAARLALVIGNAAYTEGQLKNPVNDARAMDTKLASLGFKVQKVENMKRQQIGRTVTVFAASVWPGDDVVVVFYAGHGVQVNGVNYLPAVDADIQSEVDVPLNCLNLNVLMDQLDAAKAGLKLLFLDACRNNPYARSFRSGDRGLARVGSAPSGTLIHFATRPGSVAADGSGANGLYTTHLMRYIDTPGLQVENMLKRVSVAVEAESKGLQEPWTEGSIRGDFYFNQGAAVVASLVPERVAPPAGPGQSAGVSLSDLEKEDATRKEWARWQAAMKADFDRIAAFTGSADLQAKAWERFLAAWAQDNPLSRDDEAWREQANVRRARATQSAEPARNVAQRPATPTAVAATPAPSGTVVKDCDVCPEIVQIAAGSADMGSRDFPESIPVHPVTIVGFLLGHTHVTQGQWRAVMGSDPSYFVDCGADCPVENVSWEDARAYAAKLSQLTGKRYRLPSEAEWEFAARGGTEPNVTYREQPKKGADDETWTKTNGGSQAHPVAAKKPNAYDMGGNVWQWVEDVWHEDFNGAPSDDSAWTRGGNTQIRTVRGGSLGSSVWEVGARGKHNGYAADLRTRNAGFRVARAL